MPYIQLTVVASELSELDDLAHSWQATGVSPKSIEIQMNFTEPTKVSMHSEADQILIKFRIQEFRDESGLGIRDGFILNKFLPKQLPKTAETENLESVGDSLESTSNSFMYVQMVLNVVLNEAMAKMWLMINGLQIIVLLPLVPVNYPANAQLIISNLVSVATLDLIPVDLIFPLVFDFKDSDPFN